MKKILLLFSSLLLVSSLMSQTTVEGSFEFDGETREYRVYVPAIYDGTLPTPLVFNLHGYGSNNVEQEAYGDLRPVADTANFIIVHPQGLLDNTETTHWNTFGTSTVDDVGFLSALIDTIYAAYNIDGNRIYSTGMSNGGFMSYKLACQLSGRIAAIASVTGTMINGEFDDCITNHPMPVMHIHGTADPIVDYDGNLFFKSVDELVTHFVNFNECDPDPVVTDIPNSDVSDGCTARHYLYENGLLGATVELYEIEGGEHTWPGATIETGVTNNDFNASAEIWRFFSQYTLNHLTSSIDEEKTEGLLPFEVIPNPAYDEHVSIQFADNSEKTVRVMNFLGQVISEQVTSSQKVDLTIEGEGVFFISISQNGQTRTEKLIRT